MDNVENNHRAKLVVFNRIELLEDAEQKVSKTRSQDAISFIKSRRALSAFCVMSVIKKNGKIYSRL